MEDIFTTFLFTTAALEKFTFFNDIKKLDFWVDFLLRTVLSGGFLLLVGNLYFDYVAKKKIEKFKHNLDIIKLNYQIQFSSLHKERADIIAKIYQSLTSIETSLLKIVNENFDSVEMFTNIMASLGNDVINYSNLIHLNRIYFSSETCKILDNINDNFTHITRIQLVGIDNANGVNFDMESWENFMGVFNDTSTKIYKIKLSLEDTFRELLGVQLR